MDFANDATHGFLLAWVLVMAGGFLFGVGFWFAKVVLDR